MGAPTPSHDKLLHFSNGRVHDYLSFLPARSYDSYSNYCILYHLKQHQNCVICTSKNCCHNNYTKTKQTLTIERLRMLEIDSSTHIFSFSLYSFLRTGPRACPKKVQGHGSNMWAGQFKGHGPMQSMIPKPKGVVTSHKSQAWWLSLCPL